MEIRFRGRRSMKFCRINFKGIVERNTCFFAEVSLCSVAERKSIYLLL